VNKTAAMLFSLICNLIMTPNVYGQELGKFEIFCSNSQGNIVYHVTDDFDSFAVFKDIVSENGQELRLKQYIDDVEISIVEDREIESGWTSTCDDENSEKVKGIKTLKNLSFKKVLVTKSTGGFLPMGIPGLSMDGKSLPVEYFCEEKIREEVACE